VVDNLLDRIRNFFTKQSRTTGIITVNQGQPIWTDTRYDKLADEGYTKNLYVYRCVNGLCWYPMVTLSKEQETQRDRKTSFD
jgi:hypothetical protein